MLTDEARHLVAITDLDSLEQLARQTADEVDAYRLYEEVFGVLDRRIKLPPRLVLSWGERFVAWVWSFRAHDTLPSFGAAPWTRRLLERAQAAGRWDLALALAEAVLASHAPSEHERAWWQKQRSRLAASRKTWPRRRGGATSLP